ncbi:hypothetical protein R1flu_019290 [Riccia fluitans]|uniref:Thioredoxin domain-containing protein n=1 Tax=Riccia fluitans TaxID=41844 RepID=A0ABD1ZIK3_9MARC
MDASAVVQKVVEEQVVRVAKAVEEQLDDQIAKLDNLDDDDFERLREQRLRHYKQLADKKKQWATLGHGEYSEVPVEKEFFSIVKASDRVVAHFYRENWPCKVVDKHLNILAKQHMETRFIKLNAEKSPFLTDRLKIVMLPTMALVKNAKVVDYVVGFDELGGTDEFSTEDLEDRLAKSGVLIVEDGPKSQLRSGSSRPKRTVRQGGASSKDDDTDED